MFENDIMKIFMKRKKFDSLKYKYFFIVRILHYNNFVHIMETKTLSHKSNNVKIEIYNKNEKYIIYI